MPTTKPHHLTHLNFIHRQISDPSTFATNAKANKKGLIAGGSIALLMVICALAYVVQGPMMRRRRVQRQKKEMAGYSLELQKARREGQGSSEEKVEDGSGEGVDVDVTGKGKGKEREVNEGV